MKVFKKTDESVLDYDILMGAWLPEGDEVDAAEVVYDQESSLVYQGKSLFDDRVKLWFGGGTPGETYKVKVLLHTEGGRTKEVNFIIAITEE